MCIFGAPIESTGMVWAWYGIFFRQKHLLCAGLLRVQVLRAGLINDISYIINNIWYMINWYYILLLYTWTMLPSVSQFDAVWNIWGVVSRLNSNKKQEAEEKNLKKIFSYISLITPLTWRPLHGTVSIQSVGVNIPAQF